MGDVKLAGMMGLFLGAAVAPALLIALLAGVALGAVVIARKGAREGRKTAVPFGPVPRARGAAGGFPRTAARRCLRQSLPSLKRSCVDADTPRTGDLSPVGSGLRQMRIPSRIPPLHMKLPVNLGRRSRADVVGLDIQPGFVAAVRARVNGSILAEQAAALPLPGDAVRDGEVMDEDALSDVLRELFAKSGLSRRVRVGVANQRTVLRTLELPPVTDEKELAAAVAFQAQDQVPMPLNNAVMDFHPLGIVDTPAGPRQRVVLVAAQRDMIERLLAAVRRAGLSPQGVDLSAFALIRSLYRPDPGEPGRVLYLNVDGLTNLAIAEGTVCRFTRVVGSGLEGMASELAERRSIVLTEARALLAGVDLSGPSQAEQGSSVPEQAHIRGGAPAQRRRPSRRQVRRSSLRAARTRTRASAR